MNFKEKLSKLTGYSKDILPSSYQIIGDVLLLKLPKIEKHDKKIIGNKILEMFPYVKTVCEIKKVSGEFRQPVIKKIVGNGTETIHKEHSIKFKLDVSKIIFSKGNLSERKRLIEKVKTKDVVVDMFAGIGYFSIPIANKVSKLYAIEKNPESVKYLKENAVLNGVDIEIIEGDCREISIPEKADRVIMGYFPETSKFLPKALSLLKDEGIIHYHDIYRKEELWEVPINLLKKIGQEKGYEMEILFNKKVKSYAPNIYHIVIDANFSIS